jgi:hypothetical protein
MEETNNQAIERLNREIEKIDAEIEEIEVEGTKGLFIVCGAILLFFVIMFICVIASLFK